MPLSRMRLKIAGRLKESQNTAAMLTTFNEIDCSNIMKVCRRDCGVYRHLPSYGVLEGSIAVIYHDGV